MYLVTEADRQLVEPDRMRAVSSDKNLELDRLVHMETGRLEPGLTLDWRMRRVFFSLITRKCQHLKL